MSASKSQAKQDIQAALQKIAAANDALKDELKAQQIEIWDEIDRIQDRIGPRKARESEIAQVAALLAEIADLSKRRLEIIALELAQLRSNADVADAVMDANAIKKKLEADAAAAIGASAERIRRAGKMIGRIDALLKNLMALSVLL